MAVYEEHENVAEKIPELNKKVNDILTKTGTRSEF